MNLIDGRHTAVLDPQQHEGLVLFHIGMRINRLRDVKSWMPVFIAMPKMIKELRDRPELGMLYDRTFISGRTTLQLQYWRDFDALDTFARSSDLPHLPAWRAYNQAIRGNDSVGVYHETFQIGAHGSEAIYVNMPAFGLAAATSVAPVGSRAQRARARIDPSTDDSILVES